MPQWTGKALGCLWMHAVGICGRASPGKIYIYFNSRCVLRAGAELLPFLGGRQEGGERLGR